MLRFLLTRVSLLIPTFFGMTLLAFFLIRLVPGDPIETMAGERGIDAARQLDDAGGGGVTAAANTTPTQAYICDGLMLDDSAMHTPATPRCWLSTAWTSRC